MSLMYYNMLIENICLSYFDYLIIVKEAHLRSIEFHRHAGLCLHVRRCYVC